MANLFSFPEAIDNAYWSKARATVSADATAAPDGNTTADSLIEDSTASATHYFRRQLTGLSGTTQYTQSVFAKANGRDWFIIGHNVGGGAPANGVYFNSSTGAVGTVGASSDDHGITNFGGGWFRAWVVYTSHSSGVWNADTAMANADGGVSYSGDGSSAIYFWGEYFNLGTTPEDYGLGRGALLSGVRNRLVLVP